MPSQSLAIPSDAPYPGTFYPSSRDDLTDAVLEDLDPSAALESEARLDAMSDAIIQSLNCGLGIVISWTDAIRLSCHLGIAWSYLDLGLHFSALATPSDDKSSILIIPFA